MKEKLTIHVEFWFLYCSCFSIIQIISRLSYHKIYCWDGGENADLLPLAFIQNFLYCSNFTSPAQSNFKFTTRGVIAKTGVYCSNFILHTHWNSFDLTDRTQQVVRIFYIPTSINPKSIAISYQNTSDKRQKGIKFLLLNA